MAKEKNREDKVKVIPDEVMERMMDLHQELLKKMEEGKLWKCGTAMKPRKKIEKTEQ